MVPSDIQQFERTFADLAYASLKSRAPMLMEHLVGWQLVDSSEDETRAVGIFGFKIGEQWLYKPVFFMNGELKGTELLYLKGQDIFVPMQENWINYIVNRRPYVLGESEPHTLEQLGYQPPNFTQFAESPETKRASIDIVEKMATSVQDPWAKDAVRQIFSSDPLDEKYTEAAERMDLPTFFKKAGLRAYEAFLEAMQGSEKFASAVMQFYGVDDFKDVIPDPASSRFVLKEAQDEDSPEMVNKVTGTGPDLVVITPGSNEHDVMKTLDDGEKEQLLRGELVVRDHRNDTSEVLPANVHEVLFSPTENGVYDILMRDGQFRKLLVVNNPRKIKPNSTAEVLLIDTSNGAVACVHPTGVFASKRYYDDTWADTLSNLSDSRDIQPGNTYVFIGPSGDSTKPVVVTEVNKDNKGRTYFKVGCDYNTEIQGGREYSGQHFSDTHSKYNPPPGGYNTVTDTLVMGNVASKMLRTAGSTLFIPDDFKVIKVNRFFDTANQIDPGTMADLTVAVSKIASVLPLKLYDDGTHIHTRSGSVQFPSLNKMAAMEALVSTWGLKLNDARALLKEASEQGHDGRPVHVNIHVKTLEKRAQGYEDAVPPNRVSNDVMAPYSMNRADYNKAFDALLGIEAQHPYTTTEGMRVPQDPTPTQPYKAMADYSSPIQDAAQAASTGQKDVFDMSTIARLAKTVDVGELIDTYLSDLVNGMDRVGRILFIFYWHYDKFSDRYGKEDLPELEDSLKSTFNQMGDLVLFLKQKSIEPEANIGLPLMAGVM